MVKTFAKSLAAMQGRLQRSKALGYGVKAKPGEASHSSYMSKLRAGAKHADALTRAWGASGKAAAAASNAADVMAAGLAVTDVQTEEELANLELWQRACCSTPPARLGPSLKPGR